MTVKELSKYIKKSARKRILKYIKNVGISIKQSQNNNGACL